MLKKSPYFFQQLEHLTWRSKRAESGKWNRAEFCVSSIQLCD